MEDHMAEDKVRIGGICVIDLEIQATAIVESGNVEITLVHELVRIKGMLSGADAGRLGGILLGASIDAEPGAPEEAGEIVSGAAPK
jgi:cytoskeletal protein CcmA (bactofilin family)